MDVARILWTGGILAAALLPGMAVAQHARVSVEEENFRTEPRGSIVATVRQGTLLPAGEQRDGWVQATLEGWIWVASVRRDPQGRRDLVVSASGGENLRAEPNGAILARLRTGMLLDEVGRDGNWVRVRRTGWIWRESVDLASPAATAVAATPGRAAAGGWSRAGQAGTALLAAPDGDTIALTRPLVPIEVLAREGNWARIRIEGWAWVPGFAAAEDAGEVLRDVDLADVLANPENFRGQLVEWTVQFIALDRADAVRTDFYEGEPYILARGPGGGGGFVYIAVPADRLDEIRHLSPLQRITVVGRVRTGRSRLMGAPVLDLLQLRNEE